NARRRAGPFGPANAAGCDVTRPAPQQIERQGAVTQVAEQPEHQRRMTDGHLAQAARRTHSSNELFIEDACRRLLLPPALAFRSTLRVSRRETLRRLQVEDVHVAGSEVAIHRLHSAA